tara:strand:+ start:125 stop:505 length:381 start_codon:yes stop_codon:yes gene_type:complete
MSDVFNIKVTEAELDLITCLLEQAGTMEDSTGQPAFELLHDLMEQAARPDDWTEDLEPTEIGEGFSFSITENDFIQQGIDARERMKASSRAAERRALNFSAREAGERSETQKHDLWEKPGNDPADW